MIAALVARVRAYFGLQVETPVDVRDKHGRTIASFGSADAADRFTDGYRRTPSLVKAEPVANPAKATTGSDKETLHAA